MPLQSLYSLRARYYNPSIGRFLSRDAAAYNFRNPVELNRYGYAASNPVMYSDPSGYNADSYARINNYIGQTYTFQFKKFAFSVFEGAAAGVMGYLFGTLAYTVWNEIDTLDYVRGERVNLQHIWDKFQSLITAEDIFLNFLFGGFLGGVNYLTAQGMKEEFWRITGGGATPRQIQAFGLLMTSAFTTGGFIITGIQNIMSYWAKTVRVEEEVLLDNLSFVKSVFITSFANGFSTVGALLRDMPNSVSIAFLTSINTFATYSTYR